MGGVLFASAGWLDAIARSLRKGAFMFWETPWPLILGLYPPDIVQTFLSHESMQREFADHQPAALARADKSFGGFFSRLVAP